MSVLICSDSEPASGLSSTVGCSLALVRLPNERPTAEVGTEEREGEGEEADEEADEDGRRETDCEEAREAEGPGEAAALRPCTLK